MRIRKISISISNIEVSSHNENITNIDFSILKILWGQLMFIWIDIYYKENNTIVKEWKAINVSVVQNVFFERKVQISEPSINVYYCSRMFVVIGQLSRKGYLDRIIGSTNSVVIFLVRWTWDSINERPWQLLDKKNTELFFIF